MKIRKVNWISYCSWKWDVNKDDKCSICYNDFDQSCGGDDCKVSGESCPPVEGSCTHLFHLHCIENWLNKEKEQERTDQRNWGKCPNCKQLWKVKRYFSNVEKCLS